MAVDAELISSEGFNLKFKNYLRDFFIYQFKERGIDFKVKGTNDKSKVNKDIIDGTFYPDAKRLQFALEQSAGVKWSKGEFVDLPKGRINKKRENKRVECITVDSRNIENNPFFSLYQLCSESAITPGTHFSFVYTLLLYFQLGNKVKRSDYQTLNHEQIEELNDYLKCLAENIESETRRHNPKSWKDFSEEDQEKFALEAINRFSKDHYGLEKIYNYMLLNKMCIVFSNGQFSISNDDALFIEKNVLFNVLLQYNIEIDEKQFGNKMQELTRLGVIKTEKRAQRIFYALSDAFLNDLIGNNKNFQQHFSDCVSFFAQTGALGEIGSYIQNRLQQSDHGFMRFKHNYIKRALNDYNNIDLLYAIHNKLCAFIEYRNASLDDLEYQSILCFPIEIRESVTDGRQYLIYYHPIFRSVSAIRIEFIDSITLGKIEGEEYEDYLDDDMRRAKTLIEHTWGTAFENFQEGNVKKPIESQRVRVIVCFGENEDFIKARLYREVRNCASLKEIETDEYGRCIEIVAEVASPWEMLQWLRSYTTRVVTVEINGKEFEGFTDDVIRTFESYIEPMPNLIQNISSRTGKTLLRDEIPVDFIQADNMHSLLFNEIFGVSFNRLGDILFSIINDVKISIDRITQLKKEYSNLFVSDQFSELVQWDTADKRLEQAEGFLRAFVSHKNNQTTSLFAFADGFTLTKASALLPLTSLEIQWLTNMLNHPMSKCFLNETEIKYTLDWLGEIDLFDVNSIVLHDQYIGLEDYYKNSSYEEGVFQTISKAIRENRMVAINYKSQYDKCSNYVCLPVYIEYSKRDNRFRVRAVSKTNVAKTFNLERIIDATIIDETYDKKIAEEVLNKHFKENERELVVFFNETKNVPDRILTEFSCFKKKCVKWGSKRYRMTLYYDKEDTREILVRLLSYGSLINVFDDTGEVRHELIERLEHQLEISNCLDLVFSEEPKVK